MTTAPTTTAPTTASSRTTVVHTVASGRARIDAIDAEIVRLVHERSDVSRQVQRARQADGGPRVVHARENEIVGRWRTQLGRPGGAIALALLELGRGRPS